jgi:hypothetical protein
MDRRSPQRKIDCDACASSEAGKWAHARPHTETKVCRLADLRWQVRGGLKSLHNLRQAILSERQLVIVAHHVAA